MFSRNEKEEPRMRKIRAYGKQNHIPMSLSNYVYDTTNGYDGHSMAKKSAMH